MADNAPAVNRRGPVIGLLAAETISTIGTRMSLLAIPWLIWVTTRDPSLMGLVAGAETLAYIVAGIFMTPVADRIGIRTACITTDVISAAAIGAVALWHQIGFWFVIVMVCLVGVLRSTGDKAKHAMLSPAAAVSGTPMIRVTAAYDGLNRVSMLVAAGLGGFVIYQLGSAGALWFDAATFLICAGIVALTVPAKVIAPDAPTTAPASTSDTDIATAAEPTESYLDSLKAGVAFLKSDHLLLSVVGMLFIINLFAQASATVFVPLWVDHTFGSAIALGYVGGAYALGALVGSIAFTALAPRMPRYLTVVIGLLVGGAPRFVALALSPNLTLVVIVTFLAGIAMSSFNPTYGALIYTRVPQRLLTRIFGLTGAITMGGVPLGGLVGAWLVNGFGLSTGILVAGAGYLAVTLIPIVGHRLWRQMDEIPRTGRPEQRPNELARSILRGWGRLLGRSGQVVGGWGRRLDGLGGRLGGWGGRSVRVTIAYRRGSWQLRARRGLRTIGSPQRIPATVAMARARQLGMPDLCDEIMRINTAQLAKAKARREALRGELDRIEARVIELEAAEVATTS